MVRRLYTPELANRSLALVRRIATELRDAAREVQRLWLLLQRPGASNADAHRQQLHDARQRYDELGRELEQLGVEVKDPLSGLLDFRARRGDEVVYLCWQVGEDRVDHWHTLEGGYPARRPLSEF